MSAAILTVEDVEMRFGGLKALDGVGFEVPRLSITGLIGPNGSGKSTLFNCVSGFLAPLAGNIRLNGADIVGLPSQAIARKGLARTFQTTRVPARMTVLETLMTAAPGEANETAFAALFNRAAIRRQDRANLSRARELLDLVGIAHVADEYAADLSGGQRRLLSIACVLFRDPDLILLDEPAAGINPSLVRDLMKLIARLRDTLAKTFLIVEHDMNFISNLCDGVVVLDAGRKIAEGSPTMIREDPRVLEVYLGSKRT
jgi:ABC-type branched-subunit amino acid transport system ATPase component